MLSRHNGASSQDAIAAPDLHGNDMSNCELPSLMSAMLLPAAYAAQPSV